jgi:nucleoside phosphorylase/CheY-like chemotaxis protein
MTRILIVDDKPERYAPLVERLVNSSMLDESSVIVEKCLRDGIGRLRERTFDVLVVDMLLPETPWSTPVPDGGARLLMHLREDPELNTPKYIIGVTAALEDDLEVKEVFDTQPWLLVRTSGGGNAWVERLSSFIEHALQIERSQDAVGYDLDVCFLTALKTPEFDALLDTSLSLGEPEPVDHSLFGRVGSIDSQGRQLRVVASHCLRMGSTESALVSAKLIARYRPKLLIFSGICAGYEDKVDYGDIVVADPSWDYTSAKVTVDPSGVRTVAYSPDFIGIDTDLKARVEVLSDDKAFFSNLHEGWKGDKPRSVPAMRVAPCATGPAVIADAGVLEDIRRHQHRNTLALEMEAYGVYSAVRMASRPRPICLSMKAVCDFGTFLKDDKYQRYAAYTSANTAVEFVRRYGADLAELLR